MVNKSNRNYFILVIEDEIPIADLICYALKKQGIDAEAVNTGFDGLEWLKEKHLPDLVILDLMLPDAEGFKICEEITSKYSIPVIILTAKSNVIDKVQGLELGADDYVTKPFDVLELTARVRTVLRRIKNLSEQDRVMVSPSIYIDVSERKVIKNDTEVELTPKEFDLLLFLTNNRGRVLSRDQLIDNVWGLKFYIDTRTVDIHVQRLRKKLDEDSDVSVIKTVFGVGYTIPKSD